MFLCICLHREKWFVLYYLGGSQSWFLEMPWERQFLPAVFADDTKTVEIRNNEKHRSLGSEKDMLQCSEA